ncbi:MAG: putative traO protein [Massilia sp.]|nr:putative traO protein [Massilia sp.]
MSTRSGGDAGPDAAIPDSLTKRYLVAENKFYFRDDPNLVAFEDKGKRLATDHNDPLVARSMVELAQAKKWGSIKVGGTEEFKREVWLTASLRGIDVQGYDPREVDIARLAELRGELMPKRQNTIERGLDRERPETATPADPKPARPAPSAADRNVEDRDDIYRNLTKQQRIAVDTLRAILTERGDSSKAVEMAVDLASQRFQQQRVYVGRLLAHGRAPYDNQPGEKMNYFVKLKTVSGEQTIWGVDLERGVAAAGIQPGEDLSLVYRGRKRVTVLANERDPAGKLTGKQVEAEVNRNTWAVGKLDRMRDEAKARIFEAAKNSDRHQPVVPVYDVPLPSRSGHVERPKGRSPDKPMVR